MVREGERRFAENIKCGHVNRFALSFAVTLTSIKSCRGAISGRHVADVAFLTWVISRSFSPHTNKNSNEYNGEAGGAIANCQNDAVFGSFPHPPGEGAPGSVGARVSRVT